MTILQAILVVQIVMIAWMGALYLVQQSRRDAGVVDIGWTAGLGISVILFALLIDGGAPRKWLVASLLAVWSARLAAYVFFNRVWGREEDGRYQALRSYWGSKASRNFFFFFEGQAFLITLFAAPVVVAMFNPRAGWNGWDLAGIAVWVLALFGEYIADRQLEQHRANPANRGVTCRGGLWKYSRHPNYFFEWVHWWAYVLLAVGSPYFLVSLLGPVLMWIFVLKLTGIPHTERQALSSRPDYRAYQESTNKFFPWFPRRQSC